MRTIKFRAWDKKEKRMCVWEDIHILTKTSWFDEFVLEIEKRYILLQFIGLKDKNGKEVYEGDLITRPHVKVVEVVFDDKKLLWGVRGNDKLIEGLFEYGIKDWEVIGNIYENPELLK